MKIWRKLAAFFIAAVMLGSLLVPAYAVGDEETPTEGDKAVTYTTVDEIVYTTVDVNVRTGPGMDYDIITTLMYGEAIRRVAIGDNGWSKVMYRGEIAYMYSQFLSTTDPVTGQNASVSDLYTDGLKQQIAIANGLKQRDFTAESWAVLVDALEEANIAISGTKQDKMDQAEKLLKDAIAGLVGMDYTALEQALAQAKEAVSVSGEYELVAALSAAIQDAEELRVSGDQAGVDACTETILKLLKDMEAYLDTADDPDVVIKEVEVEVPPSDDFCNIPGHRIWPVLFFVSLAVNVALGAVLMILTRKKTHRTDDVPLVDYDIDDDI